MRSATGPVQLPETVERSRALIALPRKPLKPEIDPYQQGDLDSLCGLYAIVNAIRLLHNDLDDDAALALFRKLAKTLGRTLPNAVAPLYAGISLTLLEELLITARQEAERHYGIIVTIEPLVLRRRRPSLGEVWEALRDQLDGSRVAIVMLTGLKDHWTVAYNVSDTTIRLFDSGDRHTLHRTRCTLQTTRTRFRLHLKSLLLINCER
jgi:hypothetical protein